MTVFMAFNEHIDSPLNYVAANMAVATGRLRSHVRAGFMFATAHQSATNYSAPFTPLTQGWASCYFGTHTQSSTSVNVGVNLFGLIGQNGALLGSLRCPSSSTNINFFNNMNGTTNLLFVGGNRKVDINFKIDPVDGFIFIYIDGVLVYSYTGTTTTGGITGVASLQFGNYNSASSVNLQDHWSEVLVSDQPTINSKVITRAFTAFGDVNQFTGAITDINAASDSDTTSLSEVTAGEITTFASAAIPALGVNDQITAVGINYRANAEPSSPVTRLAPLVRKAGTNYIGSAQLLGTSIANYSRFWETDPATGAAWTEAGVNAVQLGFQAQA